MLPDQIIDYTYGRAFTYFDETDQPVTHIDFTNPYRQVTRQAILTAAHKANESIVDGGVYAATQGPRLETAAEINRLERDGAQMVGMTGMPETALARELDLNYATIAIVANAAAGRGTNVDVVPLKEIEVRAALHRNTTQFRLQAGIWRFHQGKPWRNRRTTALLGQDMRSPKGTIRQVNPDRGAEWACGRIDHIPE